MKNQILLISTAILVFSCAKSFESSPLEFTDDKLIQFSITAEAPSYSDVNTKALTEAVARVKWLENDKVSVLDVTNSTYLGDLTAQSTGTTTTFSGEITQPSENVLLAYIYPAFADGTSKGAFTSYDVDLSSQIFNKSAGTSVALCAYGTQQYSPQTLGKSITFNMVTSYAKLNMASLTPFMPISSVTMTNINGGLQWKIENGALMAKPIKVNEGIIATCQNTSSNADGNVTVNIAIPASSQVGSRKIIVNGEYSATITGNARPASQYYNTTVSPFISYILKSFSVALDKTVVFAPGNLYYDGTSFHFESNQYDFRHYPGIENDVAVINGITTTTPSGTVGSFFWSKTASVAYAQTYNDSETTTSDVFFTNSTTLIPKSDFAVEGQTGIWRTLSGGSGGEWEWLLGPSSDPNPGTNCRTCTTSGMGDNTNARFAMVIVNGLKGMLIFPDTFCWNSSVMGLAPLKVNTYILNDHYVYSIAQFSAIEQAGCVFLPMVSYRINAKVSNYGSYGRYWSSATNNATKAYLMQFTNSAYNPINNLNRSNGCPVRLVKDIPQESGLSEKFGGEFDIDQNL